MSKIFDAIQKASGDEGPEDRRPGASPERGRPEDPRREPAVPETVPTLRPVEEPPLASRGGAPVLDDHFSRELAHLRANLDQILPERTPRLLLFAGSVPGEGASTVCARFAQLLAEDPQLRVSLVDADFRNAGDRPLEPVSPGTGLAAALEGTLTPAAAVRSTVSGHLDVLPSEGVTANPYPLCAEDRVRPLIDHLRATYDYAILDAAPVLSSPETSALAAQVDGVVLVVRAGRTKREIVQRALEQLKKNRARVLGVVMNRQQYVIPEFIYRRL